MKMKLLTNLAIASTLVLFFMAFFAAPADAIPAFARKNNVDCSACHSAWPLLNATALSH